MAILHLYIIPKISTGPDWGEGTMYVTGLYLKEYFDQVVAGVPAFDASDFHWEATAGQVTDRDLVCYLLRSPSRSIVQRRGGGGDVGAGGSTAWSTRDHAMISEVYWEAIEGDRNKARLLANLIFHEWMHNKLDAHPSSRVLADVHLIPNGRLSRTPVNSSMTPSAADIAQMRRGIDRRIAQYTREL